LKVELHLQQVNHIIAARRFLDQLAAMLYHPTADSIAKAQML